MCSHFKFSLHLSDASLYCLCCSSPWQPCTTYPALHQYCHPVNLHDWGINLQLNYNFIYCLIYWTRMHFLTGNPSWCKQRMSAWFLIDRYWTAFNLYLNVTLKVVMAACHHHSIYKKETSFCYLHYYTTLLILETGESNLHNVIIKLFWILFN